MKKNRKRRAPRPAELPAQITKLRADELDKATGGFKINSYDE